MTQRMQEFVAPAKRSAEVITAPDEAKAQALAAQWKGGADWTAMQAAAQKSGASAVALDDATQPEFPDAALAKAVFAAAPDAVSAPVKGALGLVRDAGHQGDARQAKSFEQVKGDLRNRVLAEKATDLMYERANKIDNLLGNGTPFDQLPGDLGTGRRRGHDGCQGDTSAGTPAPIPGPPALRSRDRRRRLQDAEGRAAAVDRGANAVGGRLGLLRAQRGGCHPAGGEAVSTR